MGSPRTHSAPLRAPFPYFGGKANAAAAVWRALGDVGGYIEPFCGSAAVLLARPHVSGRRSETLNDADGWLVNAWRAIRDKPADVARHASGPSTEIDLHARLAWLQQRRGDGLVSWLEGDPEACDAKAAGWWLYVTASGVGDPFTPGPWRVKDGRLVDTRLPEHAGDYPGVGVNRVLPHLSHTGQGIMRDLPRAAGDTGARTLARDDDYRVRAMDDYMGALSRRLRHVRIACGPWERVLGPAVLRSAAGNPAVGVLLDPPYETGTDVYATTNGGAGTGDGISARAREWCASPETAGLRIALCGYGDEHDALLDAGWRKESSRGGRGSGHSKDPAAGRRERIWFSPACADDTLALFPVTAAAAIAEAEGGAA